MAISRNLNDGFKEVSGKDVCVLLNNGIAFPRKRTVPSFPGLGTIYQQYYHGGYKMYPAHENKNRKDHST